MVLSGRSLWLIVLLLLNRNAIASESRPLCHQLNKTPVVTFIVPDYENSPFWDKLGKHAIKASKDLNIDLRLELIPNENRSRFNYAAKIESVLLANPDSDYLIAPFLYGSEQRVIELINKHQINFLSYNSPFNESVQQAIGQPREQHKLWLAHISPDDKQVGYDLTELLVSDGSAGHINIVAINGGRHSAVAMMRKQGLVEKISESHHTHLLQVVETDWSYQQSSNKARQLFQRYKSIDAIWTASDAMAIAAVKQWKLIGREKEKLPYVAGVDWTPEIVPYIANGEIMASFGGHIFEGAWLLALIKDHFHGLDFHHETSSIVKYQLKPITKENVTLLNNVDLPHQNFKKLSKCISGINQPYTFDAMELITKNIN